MIATFLMFGPSSAAVASHRPPAEDDGDRPRVAAREAAVGAKLLAAAGEASARKRWFTARVHSRRMVRGGAEGAGQAPRGEQPWGLPRLFTDPHRSEPELMLFSQLLALERRRDFHGDFDFHKFILPG